MASMAQVAAQVLRLSVTTVGPLFQPADACAHVQFYRLDDYLPADIVQVYREQFGITRDLYDWQVRIMNKPSPCSSASSYLLYFFFHPCFKSRKTR